MSLPMIMLPSYTYQDYEIWEGDWELIEGIPFAMAPKPMRKHQSIGGRIYIELVDLFEECEECEVTFETDWKISEKTVVAPDVVVTCNDNIDERFLSLPPKIIFEILSASTAKKDRNLKYELYEENGVEYYVIVDPDKNCAEIYKLNDGKYHKEAELCGGRFKFVFDECEGEFDFSKVFK